MDSRACPVSRPVAQTPPDEPLDFPNSDKDNTKLTDLQTPEKPENPAAAPPISSSLSCFSRFCACLTPARIRRFRRNTTASILPPQSIDAKGRPTLVLDLDETLVHSSFLPVSDADFVLTMDIDEKRIQVSVKKRPKVDYFLTKVGEMFEVVIFTASLQRYADPIIDQLDPNNVVTQRLYRQHCTSLSGGHVKDLSRLGRDLSRTVLVDVGCM